MKSRAALLSFVGVGAIAAVTLFGRGVPAAAAAFEAPGDPAVIKMLGAEQTLLDLTNADRTENGLPPLDFDPETLEIARARAAAQLGPNNLSHYDDSGYLAFVRLLDGAGVSYGLAGENLARAPHASDQDVLPQIEAALMKSPTHRKNILETRYSRAAIGSATDGAGRVAFAEIFRGE